MQFLKIATKHWIAEQRGELEVCKQTREKNNGKSEHFEQKIRVP